MNKWYYGNLSPNGPIECTPIGDGYYTPILSSVEGVQLDHWANPGIRITAKAMRTKQGAWMQYKNDLNVQLIHLRRNYHRERAILEQKLAVALINTDS